MDITQARRASSSLYLANRLKQETTDETQAQHVLQILYLKVIAVTKKHRMKRKLFVEKCKQKIKLSAGLLAILNVVMQFKKVKVK
jgi:hypothetical protein